MMRCAARFRRALMAIAREAAIMRAWMAVSPLLALACLPSARVLAADAALVQAAQKEGSLTWYTTQIVNQLAQPAADRFGKKYGVTVHFVRADSSDVALRIAQESEAGAVQADVFDGTGATASLMKRGLVAQWTSEEAKRLPVRSVDPNGYWVATNFYVLTPGYNTDLVAAKDAPRTLPDLLEPRWKGRMAWSSNSSPSAAPGFVGLALSAMGEVDGLAYLKRLATQNITSLGSSARQVLDQVIAGEYPLALNIFNNHAVISAERGAPCAWVAMQPALGVFSVISVTKQAAHPNAAKLFVEFMISPEGQSLFRDANYIPVDPGVAPKDPGLRPGEATFRALFKTPEEIDQSMPKWIAIYQDLFR